jgi:cAMP-dependent protein kinase regulator
MGDRFYIIEEGEAVATKIKAPGKPAEPVLNYKKGEYFGELALLRGSL